MTVGDKQLTCVMERVKPILNRLVDRTDPCPHEAIMLGYLLGLRRGILDHRKDTASVRWTRDELVHSIESLIVGVSVHGLPG